MKESVLVALRGELGAALFEVAPLGFGVGRVVCCCVKNIKLGISWIRYTSDCKATKSKSRGEVKLRTESGKQKRRTVDETVHLEGAVLGALSASVRPNYPRNRRLPDDDPYPTWVSGR